MLFLKTFIFHNKIFYLHNDQLITAFLAIVIASLKKLFLFFVF